MKYLLSLCLAGLFAASGWCGEPTVAQTLADFHRSKPDANALAFYSLDWSPSLSSALTRARKERRPVFLIANTNITAGCNFYSGHT